MIVDIMRLEKANVTTFGGALKSLCQNRFQTLLHNLLETLFHNFLEFILFSFAGSLQCVGFFSALMPDYLSKGWIKNVTFVTKKSQTILKVTPEWLTQAVEQELQK